MIPGVGQLRMHGLPGVALATRHPGTPSRFQPPAMTPTTAGVGQLRYPVPRMQVCCVIMISVFCHLSVLPVVRPKADIRPFQHCGKIRPKFRPESVQIPPKNTFFSKVQGELIKQIIIACCHSKLPPLIDFKFKPIQYMFLLHTHTHTLSLSLSFVSINQSQI